jgi:hypothetical protein
VGGWVQRFHCDATHEHFAAANADPSHRLYMCPHIHMFSYYYICVLVLLYICRPTAVCVLILLLLCISKYLSLRYYVSSYYSDDIRVLILVYIRLLSTVLVLILVYTCRLCPHTTVHVFSYYYICVLILVHSCRLCPRTTVQCTRVLMLL